MPHVNWTLFRGGIMQFARKSKKDRLLATGSFGGFRSSAFVSALFQIYFAIGFNCDILKEEYILVGSRFSNVRSKVQRAIEAVLDVYFDCKKRDWKPNELPILQSKLHLMEVHLTLVWELKQALINTESTLTAAPKMRNLHKHVHLPMYIANYGSLVHMDTCTFESYHKVATTAIWRKTSKRHNGLFHEMIQGIMQYDFNNLMCKAIKIAKDGLDYILEFAGAINIQDGVKFQRIMNTSKFRFFIKLDNSKFDLALPEMDSQVNHQNYWKQVSTQNAVNSLTKFRDLLLQNDIGEQINHAYPEVQWDEEFPNKYETYIIQGISYTSDEESQMGEGCIYATAKYNKNDTEVVRKPRYDFVLIQFEDNNKPTLARIILMFSIDSITDTDDESKIMVVLQLLIESDDNHIKQCIGVLYKWAGLQKGSINGSHAIVPAQSIMRPAFVVPIFREGYNDMKPSYLDRYVALDRSFFERSGWDVENNSSITFKDVEEQRLYLCSNQTSARLFMPSVEVRNHSSAVENNANDDDSSLSGSHFHDSSEDEDSS